MKALKFLAKALIAALGVCVIVGALNYSGFSFGDLKWLSKDEIQLLYRPRYPLRLI